MLSSWHCSCESSFNKCSTVLGGCWTLYQAIYYYYLAWQLRYKDRRLRRPRLLATYRDALLACRQLPSKFSNWARHRVTSLIRHNALLLRHAMPCHQAMWNISYYRNNSNNNVLPIVLQAVVLHVVSACLTKCWAQSDVLQSHLTANNNNNYYY